MCRCRAPYAQTLGIRFLVSTPGFKVCQMSTGKAIRFRGLLRLWPMIPSTWSPGAQLEPPQIKRKRQNAYRRGGESCSTRPI